MRTSLLQAVATVVMAVALSARGGSIQSPQPAAPLPPPVYHHIHLNSVDPARSLDWYAKYWPTGKKTTVAGFPAFQGDDLYLLYTKVDRRPPGAFDPSRYRSVPQSAFWTFGSSFVDTAGLVSRLTGLDPKQFKFLPVYGAPDDKTGVIRSALSPYGDELMTVTELKERRARQTSAAAAPRQGKHDFGYLVDPDGMLVEFNRAQTDHFWRHNHFWHERPLCTANWYTDHLGMRFGPAHDPRTGETWPSDPDLPTTKAAVERWDPCDVRVGEPSYPAFMPQGQFRSPIGIVQFGNGSWTWYTRQCRDGFCGSGSDHPLVPSRGQVVDHVALAYPDLTAVMAHLKATKVPLVKGPYAFGETRAVMIEDPDGLTLELIEMK